MSTTLGSDPLLGLLERVLDVASRRQTFIAANVTNLDTPGYRSMDLDFPSALRAAVAGASPRDGDAGGSRRLFEARPVRGLTPRTDGNNVDLDREMLALSETRSRYELAVELLRHHLRTLRYAASDGRSQR